MPDARITEIIDPDLEVLIPRFLANARNDAANMRAALNAGDMAEVRRLGHSAKGAGLGYGFAGMAEIGREIEFAATQGKPADQIVALLDRLEDYLGRIDVVYG